jgi:hypothetical protein
VSYGLRMDQEVAAFVNALRPAETALRDFLRPLLSTGIVERIAGLDHGMDIEGNRRAIEELLRVKRLPRELGWPPREVLELASHAKPKDRQGHIARLFACLVVIRADDALDPAGTLASLVESALALGPEATGEAVRYLAWCRLEEPGSWRGDAEALPLLTLGLLLAYAMSPMPKDEEIVAGLNGLWEREMPSAGGRFTTWRRLAERTEGLRVRFPD